MLSDRSAGQGSHNDAAANSAARGVCQRQRALLIFFAPGHYYRHYYPTVKPYCQLLPTVSAQEVPDVQVTVTSCYVEADILCNEWGGQEKLQSGLGDLVVVAAVSKKQVDMLLSVLPCPDAVCYTLPV